LERAKPTNHPQNHWVSGLCPSSEILNTRKHTVSEIGSISIFRWEETGTYYTASLRKSQLQSLAQSRQKPSFLVFRILDD
jgi:hypothetical protein